MEARTKEERVEYHVKHGAFWTIIWPRLKQFLKILAIFFIFAISYAVAGKYMLLGLITAPIWLFYARKYLTGKATPVVVADIEKNEARVYEIYSLEDWELDNPVWMGGILIADEIDTEGRVIKGPPLKGLGGLDFYVNRDLFLRLREEYPHLLSELAEWKYATKIRARREALRLLGAFRLIEEKGGEVRSRARRPIKLKRARQEPPPEQGGENEAGEQG